MKAKDINIARGIEQADLVIKNVNLVNVFSEEIYETDIAISGDTICGLGHGYVGKTEIDAKGYYACPAFIDGHVHLEKLYDYAGRICQSRIADRNNNRIYRSS